jgi:hypothetical protein
MGLVFKKVDRSFACFQWLLIWLLQFIRNIHVNAHGESVVEATQ